MPGDIEKLLTPAEVADMLSLSERHLRSLTAEGSIAAINISLLGARPRYRYEPSEVEDFKSRRKVVLQEVFPTSRPASRGFSLRGASTGASSLEEIRARLVAKRTAGKK
ncbi:helix-turn-helix domain-containing protein [Arsenicitalea aurantiaca]